MVSVKNIITIGALLGAAAAFVSLGGASGIGSRIGGGFKSFGDSLLGGFTGIGTSLVKGGGAGVDNGMIGPDPRTGTEGFDPIGNLTGNLKGLQNILDSFNNFATGQGKKAVAEGQQIQNIFTDRSTGNQFLGIAGKGFQISPSRPSGQGITTPFGGFINATTQANALQAAIAQSKSNFGAFF